MLKRDDRGIEVPTKFIFKIPVEEVIQKTAPGIFLGKMLIAFIQDAICSGDIDQGIQGYITNNPQATHFQTTFSFGITTH